MGRYYSVVFTAATVSAAQDLFEVTSATGARVRLHEIRLIQTSDGGSSDSEMLRVTISRGTSGTTSGSGGSSATPAAFESGDPAASSTAEVNNTTAMSGGTITTLYHGGFNVLGEYIFGLGIPPDRKPTAVNGERLTVAITVPADALTMSGTLVFEEN